MRALHRLWMVAGLWAGLAGLAGSQPHHYEEPLPPLKEETGRPERKTPRWFRGPDKNTAAEQFAHAEALRTNGQADAAVNAFDALVREWHDAPEAAPAQLAYARLLEEAGRYERAFEEYQYLFDHFTGLFPYGEALDRQFRIACEVMTRRWRFLLFFRRRDPPRALPLFEQVVKNGPNGPRAAEARYCIGRIHEEEGKVEEAIKAYEEAVSRHPGSKFAAQAAFRKALGRHAVASRHPHDEKLCEEALAALSWFVSKFPDDENTPEARSRLEDLKSRWAEMAFERAAFYERVARNPRAATVAYRQFARRFAWSPLADQALERVKALESAEGVPHEP